MGSAGGRRRSVSRARLPGGAGGSGSVGPRAGCVPRLVLAREGRRLVGAVPLYLKTNSYGEFIFDWGWANAAHRSGVSYYPKLVAAIPFTPVTGQRLPMEPGLPDAERRRGHRRDAARDPAARRRRGRVVGAFPVLHGSREGRARGGRVPAAPLDAVSLAQPRRAPVRQLRRLPDDVPLAQPQAGPQGAADRGGARADVPNRDGRRAGRSRLGGAARVLRHQHRPPRWHPLPQRTLLPGGARDAGAPGGRDARVSRHRTGRRHHQLREGRAPLRPLLGLPGRLPDAALRALLLPADRARDRAALHAVRGGRAGRAQAEARPHAGVHAQRALDPGPGSRRRDRGVHRTRGRSRSPRRRAFTNSTRRFARPAPTTKTTDSGG